MHALMFFFFQGFLKSAFEKADSKLKKLTQDQAFRERKKCGEIEAELQRMYGEGGSSVLEEVEEKRKELFSDLERMREAAKVRALQKRIRGIATYS